MNKWLVIRGANGIEYVAEVKAFQISGKSVMNERLWMIIEGGRYAQLLDEPPVQDA